MPTSNLYQQAIIQHSKNPHNYFKLSSCTHQAEGYNPICGDQLSVYLRVDTHLICEASFEGDCCAVCKTSASVMTDLINELSCDDFEHLFNYVVRLFGKDIVLTDTSLTQKYPVLDIYQAMRAYPSRYPCANLPWHTAKSALESLGSVTTEN